MMIVRLFLAVTFAVFVTGLQQPAVADASLTNAQSFVAAAARHDTATMTKLLHDDPGLVNQRDEHGQTPLHSAVKERSEIVAQLITLGADVNARDNDGLTPLHEAAQNHNEAVAALLLDKGADVNAKETKGDTPLNLAVRNRDEGMAALLLRRGADVNARGENGQMPLRESVEPPDPKSNDVNFALSKILLQKGGSYGSPFLDAIAHDNLASVKAQAKANPGLVKTRYAGLLPLDQAVFWQSYNVAEWLLSHGADVNAKNDRGETPVVHALHEVGDDQGDNGIINLLVSHGARLNIVDQNGETPLETVATMFFLDKKTVDDLLGEFIAHGADVNAPSSGSPILMTLTHYGYKDAARFLLRHGASYRNTFLDAIAAGNLAAIRARLAAAPKLANSTDSYGNTALEVAAFWDRKPIVTVLLTHGAKINAHGAEEDTALLDTVSRGDRDMAAFLLVKGADPNAKNNADQRPLTHALLAACNPPYDLRMVALLINNGASLRTLSSYESPLANAAFGGGLPLVRLLLDKGADVNWSGQKEETVLHRVIGWQYRGTAELLRQRGGRDGSSPLFDAIESGDITSIGELLKADPSLANTPVDGRTPLYDAVFWANPAVTQQLLDAGASAQGQAGVDLLEGLADAAGQVDDSIPYHAQILADYLQVAALLMTHGARSDQVASRDPENARTPLHNAAAWGETDLVTLFLKQGADANIRNAFGQTPLFDVFNEDTAAALLAGGADVNVRDRDGHTVLYEKRHTPQPPEVEGRIQKTIALLRQHGATE